ncbi:UNVERIFIED_CONTAM: hypothetical protein Sradi_5267400 [Sesamum radiatum]|uniref:Uncharacterized protein n=1 Tax=Sesamum radiatum TaxID=300843 RepID=A0AAW2LLL9_SESRA
MRQPEVVVPEQTELTVVMPRPEASLGLAQQLPAQAGDVPPQWLARLESLQNGLQDIQQQVMGALAKEQPGIPFTEEVMMDELPTNRRTPAIAEYDGTIDPQEHLSHSRTQPCYIDIPTTLSAESSSLLSLQPATMV